MLQHAFEYFDYLGLLCLLGFLELTMFNFVILGKGAISMSGCSISRLAVRSKVFGASIYPRNFGYFGLLSLLVFLG